MTSPRLSAEQRRALELLATADRDGVPQALLSAHGFDASLIAELVDRGLATLTAEKVRAGGKLIAVAKAITNHDDIAMLDGTKFKYRISAACVLENTPADPA